MADIIQLLPDSVANQIAAGEVIQSPASLVKELMENAIDAGADEISVIVKDAGRTLVQIVDNGSGMSETDARMAFERHATSKIKNANDLFAIRTMGFRGEALASIAAVAHVELNTKKENSELGTKIVIAGSKVESQEPTACPKGSCFAVKNLFYNVPARRRFLKSDSSELRNIINEFKRVVLTNPQIQFKLYSNDLLLFNLPQANLKQRIINSIGKNIKTQIIPINVDSTIVKIRGFIGNPQNAKKYVDQFFFVNNRFMIHSYLQKAIMEAYNKLIPSDVKPSYFIYFEVNPQNIDINRKPAKTEILFDDESAIWKILNAGIRESLGKFNAVPSIDFDTEGKIDIPYLRAGEDVTPPKVNFNPTFNPFDLEKGKSAPRNWESLYEGFSSSKNSWDTDSDSVVYSSGMAGENCEQLTINENNSLQYSYFQIKNRFILTPVKSGLMIIDQRRAHERILFERFLSCVNTNKSFSQHLLFPETISLNPEDSILLNEIRDDLKILGFDIVETEKDTFSVKGVPSEIANINISGLLDEIINSYKNGEVNPENEIKEQFAKIMAKNCCMNFGETLTIEEMAMIVNKLFTCKTPNYSPSGKVVISILSYEELEGRFK